MGYALIPPPPQKKTQKTTTNKTPLRNLLRNRNSHFEERMIVISPSIMSVARSVRSDMKSIRLPDVVPTIFDKLGDDKFKRISSLMEKLNRKRVCVSDNRVILGEFTSSHICE